MKKYALRESIPKDVSEKLKAYHPFVQELLYSRNITSSEDAERFLNPDYENHLHDPFLLKDIHKAIDRIVFAINNNETIAIYGDYDADGIPGSVAFNDFFKKVGYLNIVSYIPLRNEEGFGLNKEAIENLVSQNVKLIVTIDCGISDVEEIDYASKLGIDVIVTDHHLPSGIEPKAFAIINPKQKDCKYPEKMLCGSGVIFKVIQALVNDGRLNFPKGQEKWFLDMVSLATLSDMVPLLGENRVLAFYGLKVFKKSPRPGLRKLLSIAGVKQNTLSEDDIAFMVTPRINAASRMGVPSDAFKLLSTDDENDADLYARHLDEKNNERKGLVASMVKEIKKRIESRDGDMKHVLVLGDPRWKPSLLGLVASSFSDEHGRPVFLWGREGVNGDSVIKGSCRASGGVNVFSLMEKVKDVFLDFGGHKGAGGFSVSLDNIHNLEDKLNKAFIDLKQDNVSEEILVDRKISLEDVNWETYKNIEKFSPFGFDNPKPVFLLENLEVEDLKFFGKEKNHLELKFKKNDGKNIPAIDFFYTSDKFEKKPEVGQKINLIVTMEKSLFRNFPELRMRIIDIF